MKNSVVDFEVDELCQLAWEPVDKVFVEPWPDESPGNNVVLEQNDSSHALSSIDSCDNPLDIVLSVWNPHACAAPSTMELFLLREYQDLRARVEASAGELARAREELRRQTEALSRETELAENVSEAVEAIVLVLDPKGRIVRCNRYTQKLSGFHPEQARGQEWCATFFRPPVQAYARRLVEQALAGKPSATAILPMAAATGHERKVQWSFKPLSAPDPAYMLVLGHEITELRDAQQRALQVERLAAIGQMAAGLAHEGRAALQDCQIAIEFLSQKLEDRPAARDALVPLQEAVDRHQHLYEEVRSYAAPVVLSRQRCHLGELLRQTWARLRRCCPDRLGEWQEHSAAPDLHAAVDRFALERVFRNILENALAACPDPFRIGAFWTEASLETRPALRLSIRDNGPGIRVEPKCKVFEPFYTTRPQGTGLGLAIARRIVEAHGGTIAVGESDAGAEMVLTLPRGGGGVI